MPKLRELTLVSLLIVAVASACTPPGGPDIESVGISGISIEDAVAATVKAMSIEGAVDATIQAVAPDGTETPTPQPVGKAPTPKIAEVDTSVADAAAATVKAMEIADAVDATVEAMAPVATETPTPAPVVTAPTVVIESAATSTVTASAGAVTPTASVVIEVPSPTSTVTSGLVSSLATPVVQVATPTSIVSASIGTVTATAAVTTTTVPSPVPVPTPIPQPTATPTPTPVPYSYNIIEGTTPIGTSGYNYTLQGFFVENYDVIADSVSTQIKWGDSNDYTQVSVMQGTGEILANHTFTSGGSFYGEIRLVSTSNAEVVASVPITIEMDLEDIPAAVPTISVIEVATPTSTVSAGVTPTFTPTIGPSPTPTPTPTVGPTPTPAPPTVSMITTVEFIGWSPDGSKMIFSAMSTVTSRWNIWVIDFDGSNLTRLTDQSDFDGYGYGDWPAARHPDWSVNNKIVFHVRDREIWTMNPDGSGKTKTGILAAMKLETGFENPSTYNAVWSPDGSQIAFHTNIGNHVWVADPDGSNLTQISNSIDGFNWANYPSWSPDGTKICFSVRTVNGSTTASQIYMANSDGTGDMVKISDDEGASYSCTWDSTSDKMAYSIKNNPTLDESKIYVINNSAGDGKVEVEVNIPKPDQWHYLAPQRLHWRPDGSRILFSVMNGGLYSIKPDGSDKITHISGDYYAH